MSKNYPSKEPKHWYMVTVTMDYLYNIDETRQVTTSKTTNVLITPDRKHLTEQDINDIRNLGLLRLRDRYKIDPERVTDFTILNIMYLGLMSEAAYFGKKDNPQPGAANA